MEHDVAALLKGWESFYVIMGPAAAVLIGLQFVVIVLSTEIHMLGSASSISAFGSPTIVHFCVVLAVSAIVSAPWQSLSTVGDVLDACGGAALVYALVVVWRAWRQTGYRPVLEDWVWHCVLPLFAYTALLGAGLLLQHMTVLALFVVGASMLLLLFIGIHNAWDTVVYMALQQSIDAEEEI